MLDEWGRLSSFRGGGGTEQVAQPGMDEEKGTRPAINEPKEGREE